MRGTSLAVHVTTPSPATTYVGPTVPSFIQDLTVHTPDSAKLTKYVDVSAVLASLSERKREIRVAIVNRSDTDAFSVPILFGPNADVAETITIHEVWSADLKDGNGFDGEKIKTVTREEKFTGIYVLKKHSFQSASPICQVCGSNRLIFHVLKLVLVFVLT